MLSKRTNKTPGREGQTWRPRPLAALAAAALLVGAAFVGRESPPERDVVVLIEEDEYELAETLPAFVRDELVPRGFRTTIIHGDDGDFPGLAGALDSADVLVLAVRRRLPPTAQLAALRAFLDAGGSLVALRTSSHAFARRRGAPPPGRADWPTFDAEVLGGRYQGHFSHEETGVYIRPEAGSHPILTGVRPPSFPSGGTLYRSRDLAPTTEVLLYGEAAEDGETVTEPVAWTNAYGDARVVYTSLGHPDDFVQQPFRRFLLNAVYWAAGAEVPAFGAADGPEIQEYMRAFPKGAALRESAYRTPQEALAAFQLAPGLEQDVVAAEPTIYQPVEISFDERGRLWVVQYNQYPHPAGLKIRAYDEWLRAVFDTVPAPPPAHERGADRITVLEDADGDGRFEAARDVITGLNLATSVALGRGGLWVLNPPYLLKYPDPDGDGVPDGDPEVHLSGFGLEDTHAVANSLRWGPDGWLYGAQGSTTTADVRSAATEGVRWSGQGIWRYHPETRVFELFAEGGGNTFNVEFDAQGRLYSGHNGADARAFHYKQGAYYRKNWGKHGALTNPYAFGYFPHMAHDGDRDRFTHAEIVYEAAALPPRFRGTLLSLNPLHGRIEVSRLDPVGSTFRTTDVERLVTTPDGWYRPVDIQDGPDGAVYVADWYDARLNHVDPRDNWHRASGRVYRIRAPHTQPAAPFDLSQEATDALVDLLAHPDRWWRQTALRLLGDRKDATAISRLERIVRNEPGQPALDALWALNLSGGFDEAFATTVGLPHPNPHVRRWTVRLLGDARAVTPATAGRLATLAWSEPDAEVRSQLAATARRLPAGEAFPILKALLARDEDVDDPHLPLQLWWALEAHAESSRHAVLALFEDHTLWERPLVRQAILSRLAQRYAMAGGDENLGAVATLLRRAPEGEASATLVAGLLEGLRGREREADSLPLALEAALRAYEARIGGSDVALGLRRGDFEATAQALDVVADAGAERALRLAYLERLGEARPPDAVPVMLGLLRESGPAAAALQRGALQALGGYDDARIGGAVAAAYPVHLRATPEVRMAAQELLASRPDWAVHLAGLVQEKRVQPDEVLPSIVAQLRRYELPAVAALWPLPDAQPEAAEMERVQQALREGVGDAAAGRVTYRRLCGACHVLHGEGGTLGPDLTGYDRSNTADMLLHIVDPSAYVREGYVHYLLKTRDGRTLTGFLTEQSAARVTVRALSGAETTLAADQIDEMRPLPASVMPERLLTPLSAQEVRDLFAYLQSEAPSPLEDPE